MKLIQLEPGDEIVSTLRVPPAKNPTYAGTHEDVMHILIFTKLGAVIDFKTGPNYPLVQTSLFMGGQLRMPT